MERNNPKHTLAIVSMVLSIVAALSAILLIGNANGMSTNNGSIYLGLSFYSSIAAIITSVVSKKGKNKEIFSTLGLLIGGIAIILLVIFIASNS